MLFARAFQRLIVTAYDLSPFEATGTSAHTITKECRGDQRFAKSMRFQVTTHDDYER